jgi:hypothetical protein
MPHSAIAIVLLAAAVLGGCARPRNLATPAEPSPRMQIVRDIQRYGESVGFEQTGAFARHAPNQKAFYRCYYTGKLELPDSYEGLKVKDGGEQGCKIDGEKFDVFFYPIEAVASRKTPATEALTESSLERLAVVVSHEDFHQQKAIRRLPPTLEEATSTLVSFLTAAGYAKSAQGEDSLLYRNLAGEPWKFLQKAETIQRFHARLKNLYQDVTARRISEDAALREKQSLFAELERACKAMDPDPVSFNECPAAMNNAGLAFDHTYTKHYGLIYRLAESHDQDVSRLWKTLQGLPSKKWSEEEAVPFLEGLVQRP